MSISSGLLTLK